ncbi:hypothetical protein HNO52_12255 [Billgrantia diversa]|uniref:hypothetical protein n=1 Tax=Halomonas sp. MCCC 1A13316 TaxID=2733487 RepID=UPI0018A65E5C|nr:hypothetical protein [Halomonas sp. MCCC 1A13316]QOR39201.1 hypothetical protein HNO52_12255 [Halomonas sp. MCCC 1A13316]
MFVSLIPSYASLPTTTHESEIESLLDNLMSDEGLTRQQQDQLLDLLILERADIKRQLYRQQSECA